MSGADWMPEAERDGRAWTCNQMHRNTTARRTVLHWTASSRSASPKSQANYMWSNNGGTTGYHLLLPIDDNGHRPLQLRPASCAAGSLYNSGQLARSPNREGSTLIQISFICTTGDDPCVKGPGPWWPAVLDWLDEWGIPRQYIDRNWSETRVMGTDIWYSDRGGYAGHKNTPEVPGVVRKPDPGPVTDTVLWPAPTPQPPAIHPEEGTMLIADGTGAVYILSGGKLVGVQNGDTLPSLIAALGPIATVDPGTWAGILQAYGPPT